MRKYHEDNYFIFFDFIDILFSRIKQQVAFSSNVANFLVLILWEDQNLLLIREKSISGVYDLWPCVLNRNQTSGITDPGSAVRAAVYSEHRPRKRTQTWVEIKI